VATINDLELWALDFIGLDSLEFVGAKGVCSFVDAC